MCVRAYVINLKNRTDRWDSVTKQIDKLGLPIVRVDAISKHDLQHMLKIIKVKLVEKGHPITKY